MSNQIRITDKETNKVITVNNPNFYGPTINVQNLAYSDASCSIQIDNSSPETVTFNFPQKPVEEYQLAMWEHAR